MIAGQAGSGLAGTVLVIDDDPTVHDLLQRALSKKGFRGEAALEAVDRALALAEHTESSAREIVQEAMKIAASICVFTNTNIVVEEL